jgi:segregation and condensation protein A
MYTITLPTFEGPLDVLLHLIEQAELDITTIALAQVADQYLAYVRTLDTPDPHALAEFVALAARLLLIKSRALLPRPSEHAQASDSAPSDAEDDAEALLQQLRDYRRYKQTAALLRMWQERGRQTFLRVAEPPVPPVVHYYMPVYTSNELAAAVKGCLQRTTAVAEPEPVEALPLPPRLTVAEVMQRLHERLTRSHWVNFEDLLSARTTRQEIVVAFWAVLELLKRRAVVVEQALLFAPITIGRGETTIAHHNGNGNGLAPPHQA